MADVKITNLCRWCKEPIATVAGRPCSHIYVAVFDSTQLFHDECLAEVWHLAAQGRAQQPIEPKPEGTRHLQAVR